LPRWLAAVVAALMIGLLVVLWRDGGADAAVRIDPVDVEMASWANGERRWNGVDPIPIDGDLSAQAQLQADRMAACGCLYHSPSGEFGWWLNRGWRSLGENVGATTGQGIFALFGVHLAFIASPGHRANMLNPSHDAIGVAVRSSPDGRMWIAQFYGGVDTEP
jgi:uncharacterized protein YkwD